MTYPPQPPYTLQIQRAPSNGHAIAAMVLGIIAAAVGVWSLVPLAGLVAAFHAFGPAVVAVVLGHLGTRTARRMQGVGRSQALTGLVLGYLTIVIIVGTTLFWIVAIAAGQSSS